MAKETKRSYIGSEEFQQRRASVKAAIEQYACNVYKQRLAQFEKDTKVKVDRIFWEPEKYK